MVCCTIFYMVCGSESPALSIKSKYVHACTQSNARNPNCPASRSRCARTHTIIHTRACTCMQARPPIHLPGCLPACPSASLLARPPTCSHALMHVHTPGTLFFKNSGTGDKQGACVDLDDAGEPTDQPTDRPTNRPTDWEVVCFSVGSTTIGNLL